MNKRLQTDIELFAAAMSERFVSIWLRNRPIQILTDVSIREISPYIVTIHHHDGSKFHLQRSAIEIRA